LSFLETRSTRRHTRKYGTRRGRRVHVIDSGIGMREIVVRVYGLLTDASHSPPYDLSQFAFRVLGRRHQQPRAQPGRGRRAGSGAIRAGRRAATPLGAARPTGASGCRPPAGPDSAAGIAARSVGVIALDLIAPGVTNPPPSTQDCYTRDTLTGF
jgi:hypothetical protein